MSGLDSNATDSAEVPGSAEGLAPIPPRSPANAAAGQSLWHHVQVAPYQLKLIWFLWFVIFFDPHRYLSLFVGGLVLQVPQFIFASLLILLATRFPPRTWYPAFLVYFSCLVVMIPFAVNNGLARRTLKFIVLEYILALATPIFVRTMRDFIPILVIAITSFLWFGLQGMAGGKVGWHPVLGNEDGFGPYMLIGASLAYYCGQGSTPRWLKRLCTVTALVCVVGLVASFTRGGTLAAIVVAFILWVRSPQKGRTAVAVIVGSVLLAVAASIIFPDGKFWAEIRSVFEEGTTSGTGSDRWTLWKAAWKVFLANPILGVGPNNFGPFAADFFVYGDVGGDYVNPKTLYDRNLHSVYFQVLSESGAVGVVAFVFMLFDFWRRGRYLRTKRAGNAWLASGGREVSLRYISLGLELAMIGFLLTGLFYAQLYVHWLYTLIFLNTAIEVRVRAAARTLAGAHQPAAAH